MTRVRLLSSERKIKGGVGQPNFLHSYYTAFIQLNFEHAP